MDPSPDAQSVRTRPPGAPAPAPSRGRRLSTETKSFIKTSEFWVFLILSVAILIAADNIGGGRARDYFNASQSWLYVTILAFAYLISRGLAKGGTRDPYWDRPTESGDGAPLTERVRAAAQVLTEGDRRG